MGTLSLRALLQTIRITVFQVCHVDYGWQDQRSLFNQSAWEGLEDYGTEYKLNKGADGYQYFQIKDKDDLKTGINKAITKISNYFWSW